MEIIRANLSHCKLLYDWRNDDSTRINNFDSKLIDFKSHSDWFNDKLNSDNAIIWILLKEKRPIGQLRIEKKPNESWEIDYSIDKLFRKNGFGKYLISFCLKGQESKNLIAFVKSENIYSRKIFEDLGFTVEISDDGTHKYTKHAKKK